MNFTQFLSQANWFSVLVVTFLSFPLGAVWHSKLFGKAWNEDAKPQFDGSKKINFIKLFGFSAISHFVMLLGLDVLIGVQSDWFSGMLTGFGVSIVWVFTSMAVTHAFVGRSVRLILIDTGFYVVFLSLAGIILGLW